MTEFELRTIALLREIKNELADINITLNFNAYCIEQERGNNTTDPQGVTHDNHEIKRDVLTMKEAMNYLRVSRATMYRIIESGDLRAFKVAGAIRFSSKDIKAYLEKNQINKPLPRRQ